MKPPFDEALAELLAQNVHVLKCTDYVFDAIRAGKKPWEIRKNDRGFQAGDIVLLYRIERDTTKVCYSNEQAYPPIRARIGWMLQGGQFGIEPGYVIFTLELEEPSHD